MGIPTLRAFLNLDIVCLAHVWFSVTMWPTADTSVFDRAYV